MSKKTNLVIMQISDYLIVIEDKRDNDKLINLTEDGSIAKDIPSLSGYAVNGAVHYANHIVTKTSSFDEVIAIGITGDEEFHSIQPVLVSITEEGITEEKLPKLIDLQELHPNNINEWYSVNVLKEYSIEQKRIFELQNVSKEIHEDLRNYASLEGENKATVISAILLALNEEDFDIKKLTGNKYPKKTDGRPDTTRPVIDNDGMRILKAVKDYIASEGVMPEDKVNTLLNKFAFLETNVLLNETNDTLGVTPLHYFTKKLQDKVIHHFKQNTDYDILGNFYGEFVKYGGSDGNGLGIVLTPHHITTLMTELIEVLPTDYVLDPACGSGAFLISAMNRMTKLAKDRDEINRIKQHQLLGIELQEKMFQALGLTDEEIEAKFGFLVEAYHYGAPPHGGLGIGLDRLAMVMLQAESLRDVVAFPKVQNASELMSACPAPVDAESLDVLGIQVTHSEDDE